MSLRLRVQLQVRDERQDECIRSRERRDEDGAPAEVFKYHTYDGADGRDGDGGEHECIELLLAIGLRLDIEDLLAAEIDTYDVKGRGLDRFFVIVVLIEDIADFAERDDFIGTWALRHSLSNLPRKLVGHSTLGPVG